MAAAAKQSARQVIAEVVNASVTKTEIRRLLKTALASEITVSATCPSCGHDKVRVQVPDVKKQLDVVTGLLEQAEGRPGVGGGGAPTVVIERPAFDA